MSGHVPRDDDGCVDTKKYDVAQRTKTQDRLHPGPQAQKSGVNRPVSDTAMSFDIVRAVRVEGKLRHKFVLGSA